MMGPASKRTVRLLGGLLLLTVTCCSVSAADVMPNTLKANKVEFKTQAPPDPSSETPKDCYEFLYGKLSAIRRHGTTWQNGVADCSNCICVNGNISCFSHFCNGPSTGYMTPPTTDGGVVLPPPASEFDSSLPESTSQEVEGSGFPQADFAADQEADEGGFEAEWPAKVVPEKWQNELSAFETSSAPSALVLKTDGGEGGDRTENETHDVAKNYFCGKTCKKLCPQGFKIDPVTGCWKCGCAACPNRVTCKIKCAFGYALDPVTGCRTCSCAAASGSDDQDIVFTGEEVGAILLAGEGGGDEEGGGRGEGGREGEEGKEELEGADGKTNMSVTDAENEGRNTFSSSSSAASSSSSSSSSQEESEGEDEEEELEGGEEEGEDEEWAFSQSSLRYLGRATSPAARGASEEEAGTVTSFPSMRDGTLGFHDDGKEPCNTTQLRGCLDGSQKFPVGGSWSRGPCVACRCVAPGYSECNITHCHALHNCPVLRRTTPPGACCAICKEDTPTPVFFDRTHESRSTSRVPTDLLPPKHGEGGFLPKEEIFSNGEEKATIRSVPKDDQSPLLLILIPMGVLCSVGLLLLAHLWRRYHRDKYDINACRPEEKQKLRPVKTLNDDSSSLVHV